ncbi:MAG: PEP-CTERM sorting domain-containing protein [Pirellulaceae bacterium]|nr:PEP-CTERM sorting domain-containing protein [Pirellulaceae bacterium]
MTFQPLSFCCAVFVALGLASNATAQVVQAPGANYLVFEAEDFTLDEFNFVEDDNFGTGWMIIDPSDPQEVELHGSNPGTIMVPPANANMSGGKAIFDLVGGGDFADQVGWELTFDTPGEYFVYLRYSSYDMREIFGRNDYGHEDSIYLPPFDLQDDPAGPEPEIRDERAGQSSLRRNVGGDFTAEEIVDVLPTDGCRIAEEELWQVPEDECEREAVSLEGQYHWQKLRFSDDSQENRHASYSIEDTGIALDFSIATRERGSSLDAFVFSLESELTISDLDGLIAGGDPLDFDFDGELGVGDIDMLSAAIAGGDTDSKFDVNTDGSVNRSDLNFYVGDKRILHTWIGDANLDGEFNSSDLVAVFSGGRYETGGVATWAKGDWNADLVFGSGDLVAAFSDGGYEQGPKVSIAVPEPATGLLLMVGTTLWLLFRRRKSG